MTHRKHLILAFVAILVILALPKSSASGESIDECVADAGFNRYQTCSFQTAGQGLGVCNMCCTAIYNCTVWNGRQWQREIALSEWSACQGLCISDNS